MTGKRGTSSPVYPRCIGDGSKPPKGAAVKSCGIERLGESSPRGWQV